MAVARGIARQAAGLALLDRGRLVARELAALRDAFDRDHERRPEQLRQVLDLAHMVERVAPGVFASAERRDARRARPVPREPDRPD